MNDVAEEDNKKMKQDRNLNFINVVLSKFIVEIENFWALCIKWAEEKK
jgi:hypothetical protein